jgi:hypothetical protein
MRFWTLALREAEAERALVDEIEVLGDKVQAYVERYRRERARIYWLRPGRRWTIYDRSSDGLAGVGSFHGSRPSRLKCRNPASSGRERALGQEAAAGRLRSSPVR